MRTAVERKLAAEIRWLKKCFRSLKWWRVTFCPSSRYRGWCFHSTEGGPRGSISGFGHGRIPCDYALHEMLHFALAQFRTVRGGKSRRAFEEELIQDICKVYRQARSHK